MTDRRLCNREPQAGWGIEGFQLLELMADGRRLKSEMDAITKQPLSVPIDRGRKPNQAGPVNSQLAPQMKHRD
jgi:hypothetical protein